MMMKGQTGVLVPQIMEKIDEVVKFVVQERVPRHVAERAVDALD